jgi:hypothetical protein
MKPHEHFGAPVKLDRFAAELSSLYTDWGTAQARPRLPTFQAILNRVHGLTAPSVLQLLNFAVGCMENDEAYLEVGSFHGSTLLGALFGHAGHRAYAVDNFSLFDPSGTNHATLMRNLVEHGLDKQVAFHAVDFQQFFLDRRHGTPHIGLYFYDGPHDYRSQLIGLLLAVPLLAKRALIVVDDGNFAAVKQATWDFMAIRPEARLLFELPTPGNCHESFWNGIFVLAWDRTGYNGYTWPDLYARRQSPLLTSLDLLQQVGVKHQGGTIFLEPVPQ